MLSWRRQEGFTLIETLVVIAITAILLTASAQFFASLYGSLVRSNQVLVTQATSQTAFTYMVKHLGEASSPVGIDEGSETNRLSLAGDQVYFQASNGEAGDRCFRVFYKRTSLTSEPYPVGFVGATSQVLGDGQNCGDLEIAPKHGPNQNCDSTTCAADFVLDNTDGGDENFFTLATNVAPYKANQTTGIMKLFTFYDVNNQAIQTADCATTAASISFSNCKTHEGATKAASDFAFYSDSANRANIDMIEINMFVAGEAREDAPVQSYKTKITPGTGFTANAPPQINSVYAKAILEDKPEFFWRLSGEDDSTTVFSSIGSKKTADDRLVAQDPATCAANACRQPSALTNEADNFAFAAVKPADPDGSSPKKFFQTATNNRADLYDSSWTVEGWYNLEPGTTGFNTVFSSSDRRFVVQIQDGGIRFIINNTSPNTRFYSLQNTYPSSGNWHHFAFAFDNNSKDLKMYVDGVLDQTISNSPGISSANGTPSFVLVGGELLGGETQPSFTGKMDEMAIYKKALSQSRVEAHYTASGRTV